MQIADVADDPASGIAVFHRHCDDDHPEIGIVCGDVFPSTMICHVGVVVMTTFVFLLCAWRVTVI
jgi:hypothetical protein